MMQTTDKRPLHNQHKEINVMLTWEQTRTSGGPAGGGRRPAATAPARSC